MKRQDRLEDRNRLDRAAAMRRLPRSYATALITGGLLLAILLPTAVVVWDIYHDRSYDVIQDHRIRDIEGLWHVDCGPAQGMIIEFQQTHIVEAVGRVRDVSRAKRSGYRRGEEVFRVRLRRSGTWRGQLLWRSPRRAAQWRTAALRRDRQRTIGLSRKFQCLEHLSRPG